jgi:hypothetical protein
MHRCIQFLYPILLYTVTRGLVFQYIIFTIPRQPQIQMNNLNTARTHYIKADSPEVKEVVDFAEA